MQHWRALGLILGLVLLNAFFAAGEIAVVSARPVRIRQLAEQGNRSAWALLQLMKDQSRFLATIQVGITLAGFLASASAAVGLSARLGAALQRMGLAPAVAGSAAVVVVTLLLSYLTLVLGELVPKRIALQSPERVALLVARPVVLIARLTRPFVALLTASTNLVVRLLGGQGQPAERGISEEELRLYVAENTGLQEAEKRMIAGVFSVGDRSVRQVMVPRTEMACLHQDAPLPEALAEVRRHGFWRYPVYREDYDDIVGMVTVKDLLRHADPQAGARTVADVMRPAWFVPDSKQALSLLKEMQAGAVRGTGRGGAGRRRAGGRGRRTAADPHPAQPPLRDAGGAYPAPPGRHPVGEGRAGRGWVAAAGDAHGRAAHRAAAGGAGWAGHACSAGPDGGR